MVVGLPRVEGRRSLGGGDCGGADEWRQWHGGADSGGGPWRKQEVWDGVQLARMQRDRWAWLKDFWSLYDWFQFACILCIIGLRLYLIFSPTINELYADAEV